VHGFDHRIISRLGAAWSRLPRGVLLASYPIRPLEALADTGATMLWEDYGLIDQVLVDQVHGGRYRLFAWTVDDSADMQELADLGVDGLCTNFPDIARRVVGGTGGAA
jgi:glycerophosphoryl diester phosphodiesterase